MADTAADMLFEVGFTYPSTLLGISSENLRACCSVSIPLATLLSNKLQKQQDEDSRDGKRLKPSYEAYGEVTSAKRYAETDWKQQQKREKTRIMHLRPPGCSYLPVYIMHEAFDEMEKIIEREEDFEAEDFALLDALLSEMGKGFSIEDKRRDEVNKIFNKSIFINLSAPIVVASVATGTTDGTACEAGVNIEFKNEKGMGGCDPYLQNSAYYVHFWSDKGIENEEEKLYGPEKHCCPWILVEVLGQEIGLSGAVFANGVPCIQPLTCNVPFLHAPMGKHLRTSQLRLCKALRVGAEILSRWYGNPERNIVNKQAQFPYIRTYIDATGTEVSFEYETCLKGSDSSVFLAKTERADAVDILVKFVEFYGDEVHRKLSGVEMAPKLHAVEKAHMFKMVVMDFEPDAQKWDPGVDGVDHGKKIQLQNILKKLKEENFVHGDLRRSNLLVCRDGTVKLIDFDWAGQSAIARYPVELNPEASWHCDASVGKVIRIEHDQYMADQLMV